MTRKRILSDAQEVDFLIGFAGGLGHELNNLLTAMIANLSELEVTSDARSRSQIRDSLDCTMRSAQLLRWWFSILHSRSVPEPRRRALLDGDLETTLGYAMRRCEPILHCSIPQPWIEVSCESHDVTRTLYLIGATLASCLQRGSEVRADVESVGGAQPVLQLRWSEEGAHPETLARLEQLASVASAFGAQLRAEKQADGARVIVEFPAFVARRGTALIVAADDVREPVATRLRASGWATDGASSLTDALVRVVSARQEKLSYDAIIIVDLDLDCVQEELIVLSRADPTAQFVLHRPVPALGKRVRLLPGEDEDAWQQLLTDLSSRRTVS